MVFEIEWAPHGVELTMSWVCSCFDLVMGYGVRGLSLKILSQLVIGQVGWPGEGTFL